MILDLLDEADEVYSNTDHLAVMVRRADLAIHLGCSSPAPGYAVNRLSLNNPLSCYD